MKPLILKGTDISPQVTLNPESMQFEISGESRPEDAGQFYGMILSWLEEFVPSIKKSGSNQKSSPIKFKFNLIYFNTVSAKYVLEILTILYSGYSEGADIKVLWYYSEKDEDMKDSGEEFAKLVNLPFEFIQQ